MCDNDKCELRNECYRFRAVPDNHWQSWSHYAPDHNGERADMVPLMDGDKLTNTTAES